MPQSPIKTPMAAPIILGALCGVVMIVPLMLSESPAPIEVIISAAIGGLIVVAELGVIVDVRPAGRAVGWFFILAAGLAVVATALNAGLLLDEPAEVDGVEIVIAVVRIALYGWIGLTHLSWSQRHS